MLHIEYRHKPYKGTTVEIAVNNPGEIPGLRDMLNHNFIIENPAKTFANKMKAGWYDTVPEEWIIHEAERANILSDAWKDGKGDVPYATENTLTILSRLMQMYIDAEMKLRELREKTKQL